MTDPAGFVRGCRTRPKSARSDRLTDDYILDATVLLWLDHYGDVLPAVEAAAYGNRAMFAKMYRDGSGVGIGTDDVAVYAGTAWRAWGSHEHLSPDEWRDLFDWSGYREDDCQAERPKEPLALWRGATPEHRANWSWTDLRDTAIHYTSGRLVQKEIGLVWRAVVEPERLLAKISGDRKWNEYVVDTDGLTIEPDGLWCRCAVDLAPFRGSDHASRTALDLHEIVVCPRQ